MNFLKNTIRTVQKRLQRDNANLRITAKKMGLKGKVAENYVAEFYHTVPEFINAGLIPAVKNCITRIKGMA